MDRHVFLAKYPRLYHLAADGSWPSIRDHGLWATQTLVNRSELPAEERERLLSERRTESVTLSVPEIGDVVLRDHGPLNEVKLAKALTEGMTVSDWLRLLNRYVFLYPDRKPLEALQGAYGHEPVVLIELNASSMISRYDSLLRVSGINTGSTAYAAAKRGESTFQSVAMFNKTRTVKEVAIEHGIPDLAKHLIGAQRVLPDGTSEKLS